MLRTSSLFALALLGACAAPHAEDSAASEDALAVSKIENTCSAPVIAADGRSAVVKVCFTGQDQVFQMDLTSGANQRVVTVNAPQKLAAIGAASGLTWYTIARPDGTWELTLKTATGSRSVVPVFPAGASADETAAPSAYAFPDDTVVTDRFLVIKAGSGRYAIVVERTGTAPATVIDLGSARTVMIPGNQHVLVADGYASALGVTVAGTFRRLDLAGASPSLGAPVTTTVTGAETMPGSYDGTSVVAIANGTVTAIDVTTGAATTLSTGLGELYPIAARGNAVWYSGSRAGSYVIERASRSGAAPLTLATSPRFLTGTLSADASTVLFRVGKIGERMQLGTVAADGSHPAAVVWDGGGDLMLRGTAGHRVAMFMRSGGGEYEWLVDDVTGEVVTSYLQRSWEDAWHDPTIAADGSAIFLTRACKIGAIDGREIVRVSGSEDVLVPCSYASTQPGRLLPIPNSGAVLSLTPEEQVVLLKP
jgi:hypothetical protein